MAQLVNFVEYLHQNNIMHRDLKPGNIMLDTYFNLKVIDFGDAKKVDDKVLTVKEESKTPENFFKDESKKKPTKNKQEDEGLAFDDEYDEEDDS